MEAILMGNNGKQANYTKPTGFRLSPVVKDKLEKIAAWEGVDMAAVVRRLIIDEYSKNKKEIEEFLNSHEK
jgi:hypothetical protein